MILSEESQSETTNDPSDSDGNIEIDSKISIETLSEENTKKLLSRAKDIEEKQDDEKEYFVRGLKLSNKTTFKYFLHIKTISREIN